MVEACSPYRARSPSPPPSFWATPSLPDGGLSLILETVLRAEPDVVTVCLGLNDAAFLPSQLDLVRQAVDHDLSFLAARLRSTPITIAPYFPALGVGPRFGVVRRLVHERATELGLTSTDIMSTTIDGDESKLSADGIHPDDAGHAVIARAMIGVYRRLAPSLCGRGGAPVR